MITSDFEAYWDSLNFVPDLGYEAHKKTWQAATISAEKRSQYRVKNLLREALEKVEACDGLKRKELSMAFDAITENEELKQKLSEANARTRELEESAQDLKGRLNSSEVARGIAEQKLSEAMKDIEWCLGEQRKSLPRMSDHYILTTGKKMDEIRQKWKL